MQLLFWPIILNYFFAQQNLIQDSPLLRPGRPRANWLTETYKDACQYLYGENCAFNINDHQLLSDIKQIARNRTGPLRRNESIHWHLELCPQGLWHLEVMLTILIRMLCLLPVVALLHSIFLLPSSVNFWNNYVVMF